jgi:hypothetical protein
VFRFTSESVSAISGVVLKGRKTGMEAVIRIVLTLSLVLLATCTIEAQQDTGIPQSPPAKIEGKFAIAHFDREDRTVVALAYQKVGGENSCGIWISAGYMYIGKPSGTPERVYIAFVRDSTDEPKVLKSDVERTLVLMLDGEPLTLGAMPSVKEVTTGYSLTSQGLLLPMPYQTFRKIATATKVDVKLGPLKFSLTDQNLQDLRDHLGRIKT